MKGYRVELEEGERSVCLFKHPTDDLYMIRGTTGEKTRQIAFSGEAMQAILAMLERFNKGKPKRTGHMLVEPYDEPPQYRWIAVEPKTKGNV